MSCVLVKLLSIISKFSMTDFVGWQILRIAPFKRMRIELSHWQTNNMWPLQRQRILRLSFLISIAAFTLTVIYYWNSYKEPMPRAFPTQTGLYHNSSSHLPNIPPKIWQIYLDFSPEQMEPYYEQIASWISHSPSYDYTVLDKAGAYAIISKLSEDPLHSRILPLFYSMSRRVMRGDFLRYLLLAIEGGVYSDMDTKLLKPIHDWVPEQYKQATRLIIGLEADQSPPVSGTTYEVQFCQWTLAAAKGHPAMWEMVETILQTIQDRPFKDPPHDVEYTNNEVLDISGPAGFTVVVYKYLSKAAGVPIDWHNLTGLQEPRLYGDILVLPINGFATGISHSGSVPEGSPDALVRHSFGGSWRDGVS